MFSHFVTIRECDKRPDGQTDKTYLQQHSHCTLSTRLTMTSKEFVHKSLIAPADERCVCDSWRSSLF